MLKNCGGSAVPVLQQGSVQLLDHGCVVPVVVQRQMVGDTSLLVLFSRKTWTLFLEPLSDSPPGVTRQSWRLLDEFHNIFRRGSCRTTLGSTVDTYSASARGWLLEEFLVFLRCWVDSDPEVVSSLFSLWPRSSSTTAVACLFYILFYFGTQFGRANAVFSRFRLTTMMKVWVMTTTIGSQLRTSCGVMLQIMGNREGDTAFSGVEQIVASCPRSWRHREGDTASRWGAAGAVPAAMVVPVIMQRRCVLRQWECFRFSLSPGSVDIPVRNRTGTFPARVWRR